MSKVTEAVQEVRIEFLQQHRNLLAFAKEGADGVMRRVSSAAALDSQAKEDVLMYAPLVDQSGYAGEVALADFKRELHRSVARAFLECQRNLVIEFVAKISGEALAELEDIEIAAGQRPPRAVVPPPPPPLTAEQQLEAEVRTDWKHLRSSEIKRKRNNAAYRTMFDKLEAAGQLASFCTSLHDGSAGFRQ
jgi:hypothetical protein